MTRKILIKLHDSNSVVNHKQQELQAFLDGLGFSEAKDLSYFNDLDEADKFKIRGFLKKIPLKKLLKCVFDAKLHFREFLFTVLTYNT